MRLSRQDTRLSSITKANRSLNFFGVSIRCYRYPSAGREAQKRARPKSDPKPIPMYMLKTWN